MDQDAKTQFKWKFYRLTVQLNIIILLVAVSVICFFLVQIPYRVFFMVGMLVLAGVLAFDFTKKYRETKAWLDVHAVKEVKDVKE
jgi:cell division protein FtsW (lipid II flippase)